MAKIALYFPGNATHSFLLKDANGDRWQRMYDEQLGLHEIGRSGVPVTTSHQGLDYELYPFLKETLAQYPSISVANAPFAHPLMALISDDHAKWEMRNRVGNLDITFFSEFDTPKAHLIPTTYFFHLTCQTAMYSMPSGGTMAENPDFSCVPAGTVGVAYGNKIGIVMDGFEAFNKAWFAFAAIPSSENFNKVMQEIEAITKLDRAYVVIPIDLEQPWVGSVMGAKLFELLFAAIKDRGLDQSIVPMQEVMEAAAKDPVRIHQPHRILGKWNVHQVQFRHSAQMQSVMPREDRGHMLYALATDSDLLSSWNRWVLQSIAPAKSMKCRTLDGQEVSLSQGPNKSLQEMCLAAKKALLHRDLTFADHLSSLNDYSGLTHAVLAWAEREGL